MQSVISSLAMAVVGIAAAAGQESAWPSVANPEVEQWKFGVVIKAETAPALAVVAAAAVPTEWPEQKVRILKEDLSDNIRRLRYRSVGDGARQMVVEIPRLAAGESAQAIVTFEITKSEIVAREQLDGLTKPARPGRDLRIYLAPSPQIESDDREIRKLAGEVIHGKQDDWQAAEAIYDWVRENVRYREGNLQGALAALHKHEGDCEEMTSLFIALCRANGIPARTVWVPRHCYPEFYLEDSQGQGQWFPCQAAGDRHFGEMAEKRPILQKGDNFRVPEERQPMRYTHAVMQSLPKPGFAHPSITVVQESIKE